MPRWRARRYPTPPKLRGASIGPLRRDELGEDCLAHEIGRQQALGEDEVVETLLVEFLAEGLSGLLAKLQKAREAVEV